MSAEDIVAVGVIFFVSAVVLFTMFYVGETIYTKVSVASVVNASSSTVTALGGIHTLVNRLDYVLLALFFGLVVGMIVASYFVGGHPIFMLLYSLVLVVGIMISAVLANAWETMTTFAKFATTLAAFPITNHIILNLPIYMTIIGFISLVVMFGKPYAESGA